MKKIVLQRDILDKWEQHGMMRQTRRSCIMANRQGLREIRARMQELYIYDLYGFRGELKVLANILYPYEQINCIATGIHKGKRRMLVVTYYRLLIISTVFGSPAEIIEMNRELVKNPTYRKKLFTSTVSFESDGVPYRFDLVSRRVLELFVWAIGQPGPVRD
jgi:hypothetical protein